MPKGWAIMLLLMRMDDNDEECHEDMQMPKLPSSFGCQAT
jgi:hypothetical protein